MKILILGGKGYIGSKLCSTLEGDITTVDMCLFETINSKIKNIKIDYNKLDKQFLSQFKYIILLAGHSSVRMCDLYPKSVFDNNVTNFINLVNKLNDDQTLIYAGSGSVYGNCKQIWATEDYKFEEPYNMYDLTKQVIDNYYLTSNLKPRIFGLRFGTVNGYSSVLRDDVMINAMISTAWKINKVLLFNPSTKRSILGVNDLARAIQTIINSNNSNSLNGGIYNLCSFTKTAEEMAKAVSKKIACPLEIVIPEEINKQNKLNEKLVSSKYDFGLSCDKFINNFSFSFEESLDSVIDGLIENKNNIIFTNRNNSYDYGDNYVI